MICMTSWWSTYIWAKPPPPAQLIHQRPTHFLIQLTEKGWPFIRSRLTNEFTLMNIIAGGFICEMFSKALTFHFQLVALLPRTSCWCPSIETGSYKSPPFCPLSPLPLTSSAVKASAGAAELELQDIDNFHSISTDPPRTPARLPDYCLGIWFGCCSQHLKGPSSPTTPRGIQIDP